MLLSAASPETQTVIVGIAMNGAAAGIASYLWMHNRTERFLQYWALAWTSGLARWIAHYAALSNSRLLPLESLLISATMFFMVVGSYHVLPARWPKHRDVTILTAIVLAAYGLSASTIGLPIEMGYALFATVLGFSAACMLIAYRSTHLSGYAFAAGTAFYQLIIIAILLSRIGGNIAGSIIVPLYNIPLMLSIVVIAHQRDRLRLIEGENTVRRLYMRLANVEDDERRALHTELHDQVGANLSALQLQLDVASRFLARWDESRAQHHLKSARSVAAETMEVARDLMADLRPPALDAYGLVAALRTFAETQSDRLNIPIRVTGELRSRPSPLVESALFRIAQEAVINSARHASATGIDIRVADSNEKVLLKVEDDGVGFDTKLPGAGPDHWGLKNMRERARAVGGLLTIETSPGKGTRIMAEAPHFVS